MPIWYPAYIGLGSNLDEPRARVLEAAGRLAQLEATRLVLLSPLYRSRPFGPVAQPDFVNAVAGLVTQLKAHALLQALQALERTMGRPAQREHWGPRVIDLDLLSYGNERSSDPAITLPHPGIVERNFVLYPLADIAPELDLPGLGRVSELKKSLSSEGLELDEVSPRTMTTDTPHHYIVIEGPIGVGKTSLARLLAESLHANLVLEQATDNPFLERFYKNPRAGALPTQLFFLMQRAQQLTALTQQDLFAPVRVADYLLEKDRLFARVTLDDAELDLYEQVYAKLDIKAPKPDLVVYLQAPVDVLIERIARRGVEFERRIQRTYLERLNAAYSRFFHEYDAAPLLIVNAAAIDPINNTADYEELLSAIKRMERGRLYFNPLRNRSL